MNVRLHVGVVLIAIATVSLAAASSADVFSPTVSYNYPDGVSLSPVVSYSYADGAGISHVVSYSYPNGLPVSAPVSYQYHEWPGNGVLSLSSSLPVSYYYQPIVASALVQTLAASSVATVSAQLNGYLNPNGYSTTAYFEYGTTTSYGSTTISGNFGTTVQNIGFKLSGLTANTTYHCRIVAANSFGVSRGSDVTFTTSPVTTTTQPAWVAGTGGLGLRLRASPSLSATVLAVMPEAAQVTCLAETQTADGYLWRHVQFGSLTGWAASQYLVFTPPGTSPAVPVALQQLKGDGVTPINAGASIIGNSVVLVATAGGVSTDQLSIQFEVRPIGAAFSASTHQSGSVQGGTSARVTVGGLSNQGYHWRTRVIDGNGQTSAWVQFGSGAPDFVVGPANLISALFGWNPTVALAGSPVQFTAQTAGGSGWSFQWSFGDGQAATGQTVSRTFSDAGPVTATLTVTDPQGHQATDTETVPVASKQLVDAINNLAQRTSTLLDQISSQAQETVGAADYFQRSVDEAPGNIAISAFFTTLSLGGSLNDYKDAIKSSIGQDVAGVVKDKVEQSAANWLYDKIFTQGQSCSTIFMPNIQTFVAQKKSEIEQQRQAAIAAAGTFTLQQAAQVAQNLQARYAGNLAISDDYSQKELLPVTFAAIKASDESSWTMVWGEHIFNVSVGLGLVAIGPEVGASGALVTLLNVSATAGLGTLDIVNLLSQQSTDAQMLGMSLGVLGQATLSSRVMANNVKNGLQAVISGSLLTAPAGQVSVEHVAHGQLEIVGVSPRWFTTSAYANVTVRNTGTRSATFRIEAVYDNSFTATQLFPFYTFGIGTRQYDLAVTSVSNPIQLNPGEQRLVKIDYLTQNGGQVPSGLVTYTLTATTSDGNYLEAKAFGQFGTTLIDQNGVAVDHSQMPQVLLEDAPLYSTVEQAGGTTNYYLTINVQNPLEIPALVDLQQTLPVGITAIDSDGGTLNNNELLWELDLMPGESQYIQVLLNSPVPLGQPPLPDTVAWLYDEVNDSWLQFQATPSLIQVEQLLADNVGDGLPDSWRAQYFRDFDPTGTTTNNLSCATCDADGTGQNNLFKYLAGLDPTNNASVFRILSVVPQGDDLAITWQTAGGRTNVVQSTPDAGGSYSNVSPNIAIFGSGDTTTNYLDTGGATNGTSRFYRIRLVP